MQSRGGVGSLLASLALVAAGVACWSAWTSEIDVSPITPAPAAALSRDGDAGTLALPLAALLPPLETFRETLSRPLFSSTRRPVQAEIEPPQITPAPPPASVDGFRVLGVIRSSEAPPQALLATPEAPLGEWLRIGQRAVGWQLVEISDAGITLAAENIERKLSLYGDLASTPVAAPGTTPQPGKRRNSR